MTTKEPVLLVVLLEAQALRWYVAGIDLSGAAIPLVCSEAGNLSPYLDVPLDDQLHFLRHRLSGVLQRGCDRLWGREKKACQIVFVADRPFAQGEPDLSPRLAEHFVEWMNNPPVVYFMYESGFRASEPDAFRKIAGQIAPAHEPALCAGLPKLFTALKQAAAWELAPAKTAKTE